MEDEWEDSLFPEDSNRNEAWLITLIHPFGRHGYHRTTSGGRSWYLRDTDPIKECKPFEKRRFSLREKNARSNDNSKVFKYTMWEYATCKNEKQYALCKIIRKKADAVLTTEHESHSKRRRISGSQSSQQSMQMIQSQTSPIISVAPSEFRAGICRDNYSFMETDHEYGNNKNLSNGETSRPRANDFMQEDVNVNQDNGVADDAGMTIIFTELSGLILRQSESIKDGLVVIFEKLCELIFSHSQSARLAIIFTEWFKLILCHSESVKVGSLAAIFKELFQLIIPHPESGVGLEKMFESMLEMMLPHLKVHLDAMFKELFELIRHHPESIMVGLDVIFKKLFEMVFYLPEYMKIDLGAIFKKLFDLMVCHPDSIKLDPAVIFRKLFELIHHHSKSVKSVDSFSMDQLSLADIMSQENIPNKTVYGSAVPEPLNNRNKQICSAIEIKESNDKAPVQNNYDTGMKINEASGLIDSQNGLQTPSPVENSLTDFSPADITDIFGALLNDFPNSSFPHEGIIPLNPLENASNISDYDMCPDMQLAGFFGHFETSG